MKDSRRHDDARKLRDGPRDGREARSQADSRTAQALGDEVSRKAADAAAPMPKALPCAPTLNVEVALTAREQGLHRSSRQLGLSGVVSPEEGGQMRITIGVKPTQLGVMIDPTKIEAMRALFAQAKADPQEGMRRQRHDSRRCRPIRSLQPNAS